MKGVHMGTEFLGRLLVTIFIIGLIIWLMVTWFPELIDTNCMTKQGQSISKILNEAASSTSRTITGFTVNSCMEYVDFSPDLYCGFPNQGRGADTEIRRCYEMGKVGQNSGNCVDEKTYVASHGDLYAVYVYEKVLRREVLGCKEIEACKTDLRSKGSTDEDIAEMNLKCEGGRCEIDGTETEFKPVQCSDRKGTIRQIHTGANALDIDTGMVSSDGRIGNGRYSVEIGPYSIKFLGLQSSTE